MLSCFIHSRSSFGIIVQLEVPAVTKFHQHKTVPRYDATTNKLDSWYSVARSEILIFMEDVAQLIEWVI